METDFKKALCLLISDGVVTLEQAKEVIERSKKPTVSEKIKERPTWEAAERLMKFFVKELEDNGRKGYATITNTMTLERMLRLDKRQESEVNALIAWCQHDEFWCTVILTPQKLRKHYETLLAKKNRERKLPEPIVPLVKPIDVEWERSMEERHNVSVPMPKDFKSSIRKAAR